MSYYLSIKKEQCSDMPSHINPFQNHHDETKKPDKNGHTPRSQVCKVHEPAKH